MSSPVEKISPDYNYDAVMSIKKGKYYFYVKELQVLGCGDDLNSAYKDLTEKKETLIREFEEGENLNELPIPRKKTTSTFWEDFRQIKVFLIKLVIIALIGVLGLSFSKGILGSSLDPIAQGIKDKMRVSKIGKFLAVQLEDARVHDITPEMEQRILKDIRILVKRLQPYANEFRPLLKPSEVDSKYLLDESPLLDPN